MILKGVSAMTAKIKAKWKDIAIRAGKTFLQAFLASMLAGFSGVENFGMLKKLLLSAIAAGISAVMNYALSLLRDDYY